MSEGKKFIRGHWGRGKPLSAERRSKISLAKVGKPGFKKGCLEDRFWSKVEPEPNSGCWLFVGSWDSCGYGTFGVRSYVTEHAHRVVYKLCVGSIPEGMSVLHKCDVRACVNPAHLFLGTQKDNVRDMCAKGRQVALKGESHPLAKMNWKKVKIVRSLFCNGMSVAELARRYGITHRAMHLIVVGATWRE